MACQKVGRYPGLATWVDETIEYTLTFFRLPRQKEHI
jgi:transposase-like protein